MSIGKKIQPWKLKMRFQRDFNLFLKTFCKIKKWQQQNLTELKVLYEFPQNELSGIDNVSNEAR